jgi:Protein of unknown function (DUF3060)
MRAYTTDNSSRLAALAVALAVVPTALGLAGCSSTANPPGGASSTSTTATTSATSGTTAPTSSGGPTMSTSIEFRNTITYPAMGATETLNCENGKTLNVVGSNNTLTVNGTCETVTVGGINNKLTIDKINTRVTVAGSNNTVTYKDGSPKEEKLGSSNTITKGS